MFTCPICDWRVKIPRDAARPKLEDLQAWGDEMTDLPFQPEEEELLKRILDKAQAFRDFLAQYTNGNQLCRTSDEMPEMLFYLRKIEGAEVLLAYETNVFRQELHKWQPIAPEPPPIADQSLSTRKPRPTKQQKLMREFGVQKPEDLPPQFRSKTNARKKLTDQYPNGTLMPKAGESPIADNSSQAQSTGRSDTPTGQPRQASTGTAPANGAFNPKFSTDTRTSSSYSAYPARSPSPMFSPGGSQPPEGLRDPMVSGGLVGSLSEGIRDPPFPAFRRSAGLGIDADEDLRNGLASSNGETSITPADAVSPAPGEYDSMFMEMTNGDDGDGEAPATLEHEASQATEALEMIGNASNESNPDKAADDTKEPETTDFDTWTES